MTSTKWNFELIIRDRPTAFCYNDPLHFAYECTGDVTRFTGYRDP